MTSPIDMNSFIITVKTLVRMEVASADKKALSAHVENMPSHMAKLFARRICTDVFNDFTKKLKEAYPSESVCSLVALTTEAKKIEFTVGLVDSIAHVILSGESQDKILQDP